MLLLQFTMVQNDPQVEVIEFLPTKPLLCDLCHKSRILFVLFLLFRSLNLRTILATSNGNNTGNKASQYLLI